MSKNTGSGIVNLVPLLTHPSGGTSSGYIVAEMGPTPTSATSFRGYLATQMGSGGDTEIAVGDVLNAPTQDAQSKPLGQLESMGLSIHSQREMNLFMNMLG